MIDITDIIGAVVVILGAVITRYVVPWLKTKMSAGQADALAFWAAKAVQAAEELAKNGKLPKSDKFDYVVGVLQEKGFTLDETELQAVIDGTVWELINQFKAESEVA